MVLIPYHVPYSSDGPKRYIRRKQWQARRVRQGTVISLGYFERRQDAEKVEREFDLTWPPKQPA